jgi:hypothetical protein
MLNRQRLQTGGSSTELARRGRVCGLRESVTAPIDDGGDFVRTEFGEYCALDLEAQIIGMSLEQRQEIRQPPIAAEPTPCGSRACWGCCPTPADAV